MLSLRLYLYTFTYGECGYHIWLLTSVKLCNHKKVVYSQGSVYVIPFATRFHNG